MPVHCEGVDPTILNPINTWQHKSVFNLNSKKLAGQFIANFEKYLDGTPEHVIQNGGPNMKGFLS